MILTLLNEKAFALWVRVINWLTLLNGFGKQSGFPPLHFLSQSDGSFLTFAMTFHARISHRHINYEKYISFLEPKRPVSHSFELVVSTSSSDEARTFRPYDVRDYVRITRKKEAQFSFCFVEIIVSSSSTPAACSTTTCRWSEVWGRTTTAMEWSSSNQSRDMALV
jgi:hypothetical protein